ncbi:hypothetical protein K437DRAFT_271045 [Tilletiaria anomala UBC 951]|uniref:SEC7 domain-containing protein n=1 Tax=Tilletiaria anomala (strain ATCC 24038 / CBS 436.72 / UBC 951) TaxID=1037660 RepID=A0A066VDR7_TILAU|nr:uncharacterized protein K437DRAFT_271045 [Tilletiaria anomala UBC 951]KDN36740.1 hypothetical protein K437DRAFT_271045 [Tilletiaria anomala UBC 951]
MQSFDAQPCLGLLATVPVPAGSSFTSPPPSSLLVAPDAADAAERTRDNGSPSTSPSASGLTREQGSIRRTNAVAVLKRAASQREMRAHHGPEQTQGKGKEQAVGPGVDAGPCVSAGANASSSLAQVRQSAGQNASWQGVEDDGDNYISLDQPQNEYSYNLNSSSAFSQAPSMNVSTTAYTASEMPPMLSRANPSQQQQLAAALKLQMQVQQYIHTQQQIQQLQASLLAQGIPQHVVAGTIVNAGVGAGSGVAENGERAEHGQDYEDAEEEEDEDKTEEEEENEEENDHDEGQDAEQAGYTHEPPSASNQFASFPFFSGQPVSGLNSAFAPSFLSPMPPAGMLSPTSVGIGFSQHGVGVGFGDLMSSHQPLPSPGMPSPLGLSALQQPHSLRPPASMSPSVHAMSASLSGSSSTAGSSSAHATPSTCRDGPGNASASGGASSAASAPAPAAARHQPSPLPSLEQLRSRILHERHTQTLRRSASTSAAAHAVARAHALEKLMGVGSGYSQRRALSPTDELENRRNRVRRRTMLGQESDGDSCQENAETSAEGDSSGDWRRASLKSGQGTPSVSSVDKRTTFRSSTSSRKRHTFSSHRKSSIPAPRRKSTLDDSPPSLSPVTRAFFLPPLAGRRCGGEDEPQHGEIDVYDFRPRESQYGLSAESDSSDDLEDEDEKGDEIRREKRASRMPLRLNKLKLQIQTERPSFGLSGDNARPLPSPPSATSAFGGIALRSAFSSDGTGASGGERESLAGPMTPVAAGGSGLRNLPSSPQSSASKAVRPLLRRSKTIGGLSAMAEQRRKMAFVNDLMKLQGEEELAAGRLEVEDSIRRNANGATDRSRQEAQWAASGAFTNDETERQHHAHTPSTSSAADNFTLITVRSRAGSQREVARAQLLRKLSGRRLPKQGVETESLRQQEETREIAITRMDPARASPPLPPAEAHAAKFGSSGTSTTASSRARPAHLELLSSNPRGAASTLLTPSSARTGRVNRSGSISSVGTSSEAPTTARLSPGFVAARNRASAIARFTGEDNFMFESTSDREYDYEESSEAGDVGRRVPIQDMRRLSRRNERKASSDWYGESTEEDGDEDYNEVGHDDFVQMHSELQEEEEGKRTKEIAADIGTAKTATSPSINTDHTFSSRPSTSGASSNRVLSMESVTNAQIMTAMPAIFQRLHETGFGYPEYPNSVSVPLGLHVSGSPSSITKPGRGDWPMSMSSCAGRSSMADELASSKDMMDSVDQQPMPNFNVPAASSGTFSEAVNHWSYLSNTHPSYQISLANGALHAQEDAAEPTHVDGENLTQVDRVEDTLKTFTEASAASRQSGSSSGSSALPPRPISKDSFMTQTKASNELRQPATIPPRTTSNTNSGLSPIKEKLALEPPSSVSAQGRRVGHYSPTDERSALNEKLTPFPGLIVGGATIVGNGARPMTRAPTPPSHSLQMATEERSAVISASPEKPKKSLFGSIRRKNPPALYQPDESFSTTDSSVDATGKIIPTGSIDGVLSPKMSPFAEENREPVHTPSPATMKAVIGHRRLTSVDSNASEDGGSPAPLDGGFADLVHARVEHAEALAPDTFAMLHRYSHVLTQQASGVPGVSAAAMESPPRSLQRAVPVFQVVTTSGIKDRFLFLFDDILLIAKPIAAPPKSTDDAEVSPLKALGMADLSWTFSTKAILELRRIKLSIPRDHVDQAKPHPLMKSLMSRFTNDPEGAISDVITRSGLPKTSSTIAQLLLQTPDLDKDSLAAYLCHPKNRAVMQAYLANHRFAGVSIESALRALCLGIRFPKDPGAFHELLEAFAKRWTETNASLIKAEFTYELAIRLVFAMVTLNDALHQGNPAVDVPGCFSDLNTSFSREDFVSDFRRHDPASVLSDQTLLRIYASIRAEPLAQALASKEGQPLPVMLSAPMPSKLTFGQTSQPITVTIPHPDRDLAIRIYGQDITFDPPILTFSHSNSRSFTMTSKVLGTRHIVFIRAGRNSRYYAGTYSDSATQATPLPRSSVIAIERAFMQHTFIVSTSSSISTGTKRYMFSVEDNGKRSFITDALTQRIEAAKRATNSPTFSPARRATEAIAMQALRDALVDADPTSDLNTSLQRSASAGAAQSLAARKSPTASAAALARATSSSAAPPPGGFGGGLRVATLKNAFGGFGLVVPSQKQGLDRQTSTSKHYYAPGGAGSMERELLPDSICEEEESAGQGQYRQQHPQHLQQMQAHPQHGAGSLAVPGSAEPSKVKTGHEIVTICQQNSLLPLVLGYFKKT